MKKEKLIETESDPIDKRVKYIKSTVKGQKLLEEALLTEFLIADSVMKGITQRQATELCRLLDKLLININLRDDFTCFGKKS
jgi:DNA-binding MarR family transcriptional regulator